MKYALNEHIQAYNKGVRMMHLVSIVVYFSLTFHWRFLAFGSFKPYLSSIKLIGQGSQALEILHLQRLVSLNVF